MLAPASLREIAERFGLGDFRSDAARVARGAMGEVFRIDTASGSFALKRLFFGPAGDEEANAEFQITAAKAGVSLALPVLASDAEVAVRVQDLWWRAYEWIEGDHVPITGPAPRNIAIDVARNLGLLHGLRYSFDQEVDGWFLGSSEDEIQEALDTAERAGVDVTGARRTMPGLASVSRMQQTGLPIGCHNDPDRPNVLVAPYRQATLIDWDNAGPCYADGEFAGALWHWAVEGNKTNSSTAIASMTHAYREAGGDFANPGLEVFATMCASWINYTINCCEHLADSGTSPETLEFERPLIDALAAYPVSVQTLETILDSVPNG